ncbi:hypothetical protein L228DRAFT_270406 [Xylona heveae TC161]|uniref:SH3 domain-containing protein n=1 Tax=Xylona heveae (strain CBS 132557 / TC161) TaxID=1328760 RepID=A0A165AE13_XYLHT|nr:hypothetical protein L228DRAFT_270406 [Xylona heveae TC161]KZF20323.1 hypothetical protein L228DRAFT_270406 [Xylona heveae TC161]
MMPNSPALPTRFPCWCRAIYSWGGETKQDLGFIEGDLIECLNAGDGSWWTGRLRRDRRMVGLFPSNFVKVLDDDFRPVNRASSQMPGGGSMRGAAPSPKKAKSTFRKPFQAYAAAGSPNPAAAQREIDEKLRGPSPIPSRAPSPAPPTSRAPSRLQRPTSSAANLPYLVRASSPAPPISRSPQPRQPSPNPYQSYEPSPPPPAPPPHRVVYDGRRTPSPAPSFTRQQYLGQGVSRGPSPTPSATGHTPSPLRNAMEDVMSSLQDMGISQESPLQQRPRSPLNPWSPEAFDQLYARPSLSQQQRPGTSLSAFGDVDEIGYPSPARPQSRIQPRYEYEDDGGPPEVSNYVARMESHLEKMQEQTSGPQDELFLPTGFTNAQPSIADDYAPAPPPKQTTHENRSHSSLGKSRHDSVDSRRRLKRRKSAYDIGKEMLGRTFTMRSSATNSSSGVQSTTTNDSNSTQLTSQSAMSGFSAGGFSATSAGSLARRRGDEQPPNVLHSRAKSHLGIGNTGKPFAIPETRPQTPMRGVTYHSDQRSPPLSQSDWAGSVSESNAVLGGLTSPKAKKSGFFKKIIESAKTGAASARSSIASSQVGRPLTPHKHTSSTGIGPTPSTSPNKETGIGGGADWVQVRRDVNRSNTLSRNERDERAERCQMLDIPVIDPIGALYDSAEGDEGLDGLPIEEPTNFLKLNLSLVDRNARFVSSLPPMTNPISLAQGYICRPYKSDVQRLRAIFTWVSEKIVWEEDFEGEIDARRVVQTKRGCSEEIAVLVTEMCAAVGLHAEVVRGHLKHPGEAYEPDTVAEPNHWWNAVIADGEWRIMDCSLANPTNPRRGLFSSAGSQAAENWYFLARPMEICYTHVPLMPEHQHICPPVPPEVLLALPCACPPYFKNGLQLQDFDTSLLQLSDLEMVQLQITVPSDIECVAEVETQAFNQDVDGDLFESGEVIKKPALAQAEWYSGQKQYTIKGLLPGDERQGVLKVFAGKRGLMHSIKDNPHALAFAVPIVHRGENPPYDFFTRHPTPHAQRHDIYVMQPQCARLAVNNTFVFCVRQHPSSFPGLSSPTPQQDARPSSAMSTSTSSGAVINGVKAAKLAIQAPSGKILRLMRKSDHSTTPMNSAADGTMWETIIKIGERGVWRGLVLADRSARWCVFAEWNCI